MPTQSEPTLALALGFDGSPMHEQLTDAAKACLALDVKQKLGTLLAPQFWGGVGSEVEAALSKGLADVSISEVLVGAWLKARELRRYADPALHPPGEPSVAALAKHSITSRHTIEVDLLVAGAKTSTLTLDLELQLEIEAAHLRILDGRVRAIGLGKLTVSAAVDCAGKELKRFPLREIEVPHEIVLEHPIPIVLPDRYAPAVTLPADARVPSVTPPLPPPPA
jgi:hypothetical protein